MTRALETPLSGLCPWTVKKKAAEEKAASEQPASVAAISPRDNSEHLSAGGDPFEIHALVLKRPSGLVVARCASVADRALAQRVPAESAQWLAAVAAARLGSVRLLFIDGGTEPELDPQRAYFRSKLIPAWKNVLPGACLFRCD